MKYESELSPWGEIDESHPEGEFWAYQSERRGPRGRCTKTNIVTDRDMSDYSTTGYESMGCTSWINSVWRVSVKNGVVRRIKA